MPSRQSWSNAIGSRAVGEQLLVDDVEHLEERHVGADASARRSPRTRRARRAGLAPDAELQVHACAGSCLSATCSCAVRGGRTRTRAASLWSSGAVPTPVNSHAATYEKCSSSRSASPSSVWCSTRKWPPQLSSRCSASRHEQLAELEEVGDAAGLLERLVERRRSPSTLHVGVELLAERGDLGERLLEGLLAARHAAVVPQHVAELAVEVVDRALAVDREEALASGRRPPPPPRGTRGRRSAPASSPSSGAR